MTLGQRISALRNERGLTQERFAELLGISKSAVGMYETDRREPNLETLDAIADFFNVDMDYLRGKSDCRNMYQYLLANNGLPDNVVPVRTGANNAPSDKLSKEALDIAVGFDNLDARGKRVVRAVLTCESNEQGSQPATPKAKHRSDGFVEIRVYDQPAAAGLGNYLDEPPHHLEQYPTDEIPAKTDFGILISGDSMEPEIQNGATVFVQASPVVEPGQVGIFVLDGKAYCKRLTVDHDNRTVHLVSANPSYADIIIQDEDDLYTMGRVLGSYSPKLNF